MFEKIEFPVCGQSRKHRNKDILARIVWIDADTSHDHGALLSAQKKLTSQRRAPRPAPPELD